MTMQIERATMGFATAAAIMAAMFTAGGWVAFVEYRLAQHEEIGEANNALLVNICETLQCRKNGMRE